MATKKEVREALHEAVLIGQSNSREAKRHRTTTEKIMVRAAENCYAAHLVGAVSADGFAPANTGETGKAQVREAAEAGKVLSAKGYALLIGYSPAYVSRLYRLGFGLAAGILDPNERPKQGPTRWQLISRQVGDSPEVGAVLGKDVEQLPTTQALDAAIEAALDRRAQERAAAAAAPPEWMPKPTGQRIDYLTELVEVIHDAPKFSATQVERLSHVLDTLRETIEAWMLGHDIEAEHPDRKAS